MTTKLHVISWVLTKGTVRENVTMWEISVTARITGFQGNLRHFRHNTFNVV